MRQVYNPYGIAHVEDVHRGRGGQSTRLNYQLCGLGDGHKVPNHVWVCYGDGLASFNLASEYGKHAAPTAQDVSKAHAHEMSSIRMPLRPKLYDALTYPL